jgi:peptidoglycan/LPS O-acetylase OafA/YrhL
MEKQNILAQTKGEILPLTSFRAWAALFVFLHHDLAIWHRWRVVAGPAKHRDDHPWWIALINEGRVGVTMFFVLSGFLLTLRYFDSLLRGASLKEYFLKRVARIWPLYLFVCGLTFACALYYGDPHLERYWVYFTLTQGFFRDLRFLGVGTAWSLTVEECFYLLLPVVILAFRQWLPTDGKTWKSFLSACAILAAMIGFLALVGKVLANRDIDLWRFMDKKSHHWIEYTIFGRFADFALGIAAAVIYMRSSNRLLGRPILVDVGVLACLGVLGFSCCQFYYDWGIIGHDKWHYVSALSSAVLIYLLCAPRSLFVWLNSFRFFVYMGRVSYGYYLIHSAVFIYPIYRLIERWHHNTWMGGLPLVVQEGLQMLACLSAGVILSVILYELVERPGQKLVLRWSGISSKKKEAAPDSPVVPPVAVAASEPEEAGAALKPSLAAETS